MGSRSLKVVSLSDVFAFEDTWYPTLDRLEAHHARLETIINRFRVCFFSHFLLGDSVPNTDGLVERFQQYAEMFYDPSALGYNGIIYEIKKRTSLYAENDGFVSVREFLKHEDGKTDYYDGINRKAYEQKTGTGDWLRSEKSCTFSDIIKEYRRKRTLICWDYDFIPESEDMNGKKCVNKYWSNEKKQSAQERTNKTRKDGTPIINKQYEIHIHICTSYAKLFDYMETYGKGLETFFKESVRSGVAGVYVWEMQTIKNSKKKIDFLMNCPYNATKPETDESEED